jgi:hypothetical protein
MGRRKIKSSRESILDVKLPLGQRRLRAASPCSVRCLSGYLVLAQADPIAVNPPGAQTEMLSPVGVPKLVEEFWLVGHELGGYVLGHASQSLFPYAPPR